MNQIARCDWLPERARWSHLARSGLPAVSRMKNFPESHIISPLLTKFVRSRWLGIGLVLFCEFMDLDFVSVHKHAKKELGQYPAILTSHSPIHIDTIIKSFIQSVKLDYFATKWLPFISNSLKWEIFEPSAKLQNTGPLLIIHQTSRLVWLVCSLSSTAGLKEPNELATKDIDLGRNEPLDICNFKSDPVLCSCATNYSIHGRF